MEKTVNKFWTFIYSMIKTAGMTIKKRKDLNCKGLCSYESTVQCLRSSWSLRCGFFIFLHLCNPASLLSVAALFKKFEHHRCLKRRETSCRHSATGVTRDGSSLCCPPCSIHQLHSLNVQSHLYFHLCFCQTLTHSDLLIKPQSTSTAMFCVQCLVWK